MYAYSVRKSSNWKIKKKKKKKKDAWENVEVERKLSGKPGLGRATRSGDGGGEVQGEGEVWR